MEASTSPPIESGTRHALGTSRYYRPESSFEHFATPMPECYLLSTDQLQ